MSRLSRVRSVRVGGRAILAVLALWLAASDAAAQDRGPGETIDSVVVHGNHTTPTAEVLAITGDLVGLPAGPDTVTAARSKLERSGRFAGVDVRQRYLSLDDPSRVLLVIVVDEHDAVSASDLNPGPLKRFAASAMWSPMLEYQEGYGLTYGLRVSVVDRLGRGSRISMPLTWGGERQAQLEVERRFDGPVARIVGGGGVHRRENPAYDLGDTRHVLWARVESAPRPWLRGGGGVRHGGVRFADIDEGLTTLAADLTVDTRRDPALPRNAVYLMAGIERLAFADAALGDDAREVGEAGVRPARRLTVDARGYLALVGPTVLALRAHAVTTSRPLPRFEQALLGGSASLRGWDVGSAAADNLAALSAEMLIPLTSPLQQFARLGVKLFADTATVYDAGERLGEQAFRSGYGGGVFVNATVFRFALDLGWRPGRTRPNAHLQLGVRLTR